MYTTIPERYIKDYIWNAETMPEQSLERIIEIVDSHIKSIRFGLSDEITQTDDYNKYDDMDDNDHDNNEDDYWNL